MGNGGPGPEPAAGTVCMSKLESGSSTRTKAENVKRRGPGPLNDEKPKTEKKPPNLVKITRIKT